MQAPQTYADDNPLIVAIRLNDDCRARGFRLFDGDDDGGTKTLLVINEMAHEKGYTGFEGVDFKAINTLANDHGLSWSTDTPATSCLAAVAAQPEGPWLMNPLETSVRFCLQKLLDSAPALLYEVHQLALRPSGSRLFCERGQFPSLVSDDGTMEQAVRDLILANVTGEGMDLHLSETR